MNPGNQHRIDYRVGALESLRSLMGDLACRCILLVTGRRSYELSGAEAYIDELLADRRVIRFSDFGVNADISGVRRGLDAFRSNRCDAVIGIGGGSVMDTAKAIALLVDQSGEPIEYITGRREPSPRNTPAVMIPTTIGSGSESTRFCVIYVDGIKQSLDHASVLPDYALVDPRLVVSLPAAVAASSGIDTVCQAIESYWAVQATGDSREFARRALSLARPNLAQAVRDPESESRARMLLAANYAGRAINISRTTAAHAMSYPITVRFGLAHGHAVALTLPYLVEFNGAITAETAQPGVRAEAVRRSIHELCDLLEIKSPAAAREWIHGLMRQIGLETRLSRLGVDREGLEQLISDGFDNRRAVNNPRVVSPADYRAIMERVW